MGENRLLILTLDFSNYRPKIEMPGKTAYVLVKGLINHHRLLIAFSFCTNAR